MKRILFLLLLLTVIIGCKPKKKEMTLDELEKASWTKLDKGIEFIELEKYKGDPKLRIYYDVTLKSELGIDSSNEMTRYVQELFESILNSALVEKQKTSQHGYLKVFPSEILSAGDYKIMVFLRGNIDSMIAVKYIDDIKTMLKGVKKIEFESAEMTKQAYISDGNEDWSKVLSENPLPGAIDIKVDQGSVNKASIKAFKEKMMQYDGVTDVQYPELPLLNDRPPLYFEYKRR